MTKRKNKLTRVLSIDVTSRGFGFAVLESQTTLADWGVKTVGKQKQEQTLARVSELIARYKPDMLVIEDYHESRRCDRIKRLLRALLRLVESKRVKIRSLSMSKVKAVFGAFHATTKHEIALEIGRQLPALVDELPRYRKPWMNEAYRMAIFDAVSLGLTYYYSKGVRDRAARDNDGRIGVSGKDSK